MFARMLWKAGLGAALLLLTSCREAEAAKTPEERAREVVELLVAGNYQSLYEMFTPEMQKALPVEAMRSKVGPSMKPLGKLLETGKPSISTVGDLHGGRPAGQIRGRMVGFHDFSERCGADRRVVHEARGAAETRACGNAGAGATEGRHAT